MFVSKCDSFVCTDIQLWTPIKFSIDLMNYFNLCPQAGQAPERILKCKETFPPLSSVWVQAFGDATVLPVMSSCISGGCGFALLSLLITLSA